jgi:membrane associated rhomboid family serine protease
MIASMGSTGASVLLGFEDVAGIGASGAIGGLLGAYLLLFFNTKIQTIYMLWSILRIPTLPFRPQQKQIWKWVTTIPAFWFLLFFAGLQAFYAFISAQSGQTGGVDYFAHYFGFIAGMTIFLFLRKDMVVRYATGRAL